MSAYVIANVQILDPAGYQAYSDQVLETVARHGGRFIVRGGGAVEILEGEWQTHRVVVIEFPDRASAERWYRSPEYQAILPIRLQHGAAQFVAIVDGVPTGV